MCVCACVHACMCALRGGVHACACAWWVGLGVRSIGRSEGRSEVEGCL